MSETVESTETVEATTEDSGLTQDEQFKVDMFNKSIEILKQFETADEIAEYFESLGIKAIPGNASSCAISEFIKSNMS